MEKDSMKIDDSGIMVIDDEKELLEGSIEEEKLSWLAGGMIFCLV